MLGSSEPTLAMDGATELSRRWKVRVKISVGSLKVQAHPKRRSMQYHLPLYYPAKPKARLIPNP